MEALGLQVEPQDMSAARVVLHHRPAPGSQSRALERRAQLLLAAAASPIRKARSLTAVDCAATSTGSRILRKVPETGIKQCLFW